MALPPAPIPYLLTPAMSRSYPGVRMIAFFSPSFFFYVAFKLSFIVGNWGGTFWFIRGDSGFARFLTVWAIRRAELTGGARVREP